MALFVTLVVLVIAAEGNALKLPTLRRPNALQHSAALSLVLLSPHTSAASLIPSELSSDSEIRTVEFRTPAVGRSERAATSPSLRLRRQQKPLPPLTAKDAIAASCLGVSAFLLAGSTSSPLSLPLANLMGYDEEDDWVKDRQEGLSSSPPAGFTLTLSVIALLFGVIAERGVMKLSEGDVYITIQLSVLAVLWGTFIEFGRFVVGEKGVTREENDKDQLMCDDFLDFAKESITLTSPTTSEHQSDIIKSFRRSNTSYRNSEQVSDSQIINVLDTFLRANGEGRKVSNAGFVKGVQLKQRVDGF